MKKQLDNIQQQRVDYAHKMHRASKAALALPGPEDLKAPLAGWFKNEISEAVKGNRDHKLNTFD